MVRALLFYVIVVVIFLAGAFLFFQHSPSRQAPIVSQQKDLPAAAALSGASSSLPTATSTATTTEKQAPVTQIVKKSLNKAKIQQPTGTSGEAQRIHDPYPTPPEAFDQINAEARDALINILCEPQGGSSLNPISGSGVIIDPRGVILTNAHVAQYVLLSESPQINLKCSIRTGSPASPQWTATVLYIPSIWVSQHSGEINTPHPTGTGEHDYALLYITGSTTGSPLPSSFPYLPVDTRSAIGFPGDQVLVASYPAELVGGIAAQYNLFADSTVTSIKQLLTFGSGTPDVLSLGGVIEAQGGSSGGAVVNAWGRLIAIIATTSEGSTTAERDLRGDSLNYINSDLGVQTGLSLSSLLEQDPLITAQKFSSVVAPGLIQLYVNSLSVQPN